MKYISKAADASGEYPYHPGSYDHAPDTSRAAAKTIVNVAQSHRDRILEVLRGEAFGLSSEAIASRLGLTRYAVRPRISELVAMKAVVETPYRENWPLCGDLEGRAMSSKQLSLVPDQGISEVKPGDKPPAKPIVSHTLTTSAAVVSDPDAFDWDNPEEDAIVMREQRATAVYRNRHGELIIRQRASWNDDEDTFVFISPENEVTFMEGLAKRARED